MKQVACKSTMGSSLAHFADELIVHVLSSVELDRRGIVLCHASGACSRLLRLAEQTAERECAAQGRVRIGGRV